MGSPATPLIHHLPITEARRNLGGLVRRLHKKGEYFVFVKDGEVPAVVLAIPVAALMDPDELDDYLDLQDPAITRRRRSRSWRANRPEAKHGQGRDGHALLAELRNEHATAGRRRRG